MIQFYHLLSTPLERALPKLLEKALAAQQRCVVLTDSEARLQALDDALWTVDAASFIPHGSAAQGGEAMQQPVWLSLREENPNEAAILVITDGSQPAAPEAYAKVLDLFDGHDESAVAAARTRWKHYKEAGHALSYIQQQPGGGWKQMA